MVKKEETIKNTIDIIAKFKQRLSIRQIYYQLVAHYGLENNKSNYKQFDSILVKARKQGLIDYFEIEDRTRDFDLVMKLNPIEVDLNKKAEKRIEAVLTGFDAPAYDEYDFQETLLIIACEKQALQAFFKNCIYNSNVCLVICRGYNSLTQIYELSEAISKLNTIKHIKIAYFGDFDPSGKDIERNFIKQLKEQFERAKINIPIENERIALTEEQIKKYNLPTSLPKSSDSRTKNANMNISVELDALDPSELENLIKKVQSENFDSKVYKQINRYNEILQRRYIKSLIRNAKKILSIY